MKSPDYVGRIGHMWEISRDRKKDDPPDWDASLITYLIHIPSAHPLWPQYGLTLIHLRPIEGVKPAELDRPDATHEVMLVAFNVPELGNFTYENLYEKRRNPRAILLPINMRQQMVSLLDDEAKSITTNIGKALCDGLLPAEPDDYIGSRKRWKEMVELANSHYTFGHDNKFKT